MEPPLKKRKLMDEMLQVTIENVRNVLDSGSIVCFDGGKIDVDSADVWKVCDLVFRFCTVPNQEDNEGRLYGFLKEYLEDLVGKRRDIELKRVVVFWNQYLSFLDRYVCKLCGHLDRFYVEKEEVLSTKELGLFIFEKYIFSMHFKELERFSLESLRQLREMYPTCPDVNEYVYLKGIFDLFSTFSRGNCDIEHDLLHETGNFYHALGKKWLSSCSLSEYIHLAESAIVREEKFGNLFFPAEYRAKVLAICLHQLLRENEAELLRKDGSGVHKLLENENFTTLSKLFLIMERIDGGLQPIIDILCDHIRQIGLCINSKYRDWEYETYHEFIRILLKNYMDEILNFYVKMHHVAKKCFNLHPLVVKALSRGFSETINSTIEPKNFSIPIVQIFSFYFDWLIREHPSYFEGRVDILLPMVCLFNDKDVFVDHYRHLLSIRLFSMNVIEEDEKYVIGKFKSTLGADADIYKLERMLQDKSCSIVLEENFRSYVQERNISIACDVHFQVLTKCSWPTFPSACNGFILPKPLSTLNSTFESYYQKDHPQRMLQWMMNHSTVTLLGRLKRGDHQIEGNAFQASILLLFNQGSELTLEFIQRSLGLNEKEIIPLILALRGKRSRLLKFRNDSQLNWHQNSKTVFYLNDKFQQKSFRVALPHPRYNQREAKVTETSIHKERCVVLEAMIVKIMKTHQEMKVTDLIQLVIQAAHHRFMATSKQVKLRIESLIQRDFLERNREIVYYRA